MAAGMRMRAHEGRRGTTLLEAVIAAALLVLLAGVAARSSQSMGAGYRTEAAVSKLRGNASVAAREVSSLLRSADLDGVQPPAVPNQVSISETLEFQRSAPGAPVEVLQFEYEPSDPNDGVDNDGDGLVDEGRLVLVQNPMQVNERRRVLLSSVSENLEGEVPGNLLDDNGNGLTDEMGVCFEYTERTVTFHLTLAERLREGALVEVTVARTVTPRNTPEPEAVP